MSEAAALTIVQVDAAILASTLVVAAFISGTLTNKASESTLDHVAAETWARRLAMRLTITVSLCVVGIGVGTAQALWESTILSWLTIGALATSVLSFAASSWSVLSRMRRSRSWFG